MGLVDTLPVKRVRPVLFLPLWLGTLRDRSDAQHVVTPSPGHWTTRGGRDGYYCAPAGAKLAVTHASDLQSSSLTYFWWGRHDRQVTNARIVSKRDGGAPKYEIYTAATALVFIDGSTVRSRTFAICEHTSVAVTLESGQAANVYADGVLDGAMNGASVLTENAADLNITGYYVAGFPWENQLDGLLMYTDILTAPEISALHSWAVERTTPSLQWPGGGMDYTGSTYTGEPKYVDSIQSARVSLANETSGNLSNTDLRIISGTWALTESAAGRAVTCVAAGKLRYQLIGASGFTTAAFTETGGATLTKNANDFEIDAGAGDTVSRIVLTAA